MPRNSEKPRKKPYTAVQLAELAEKIADMAGKVTGIQLSLKAKGHDAFLVDGQEMVPDAAERVNRFLNRCQSGVDELKKKVGTAAKASTPRRRGVTRPKPE